jgi:pimeloyl-ACP methyl ester carboxylesterase
MTTISETVHSTPRAGRYRAAEQAIWERFGLSPVERWVELDQPSARLRVVELGSGEPVLFVPGSGGTGPYWAPLIAQLTRFRCLMLDRPGWGLSSPVKYDSRDYSTMTARILKGVLEGLGIQRAYVVGASVGGAWALRLAQRHPSTVGRVVLLGGSPTQELEIPRFIKLLRSPIGAIVVRLPMGEGRIRDLLRGLGHGGTLDAGRMDDVVEWRQAFHRYSESLAWRTATECRD